MNRLIDELNYYAKIETNRIPYHFCQLPALEYFQDFSVEVAMDLDAMGYQFETDFLLEESVEVIADPEQLRKVLNNIISNAIKYWVNPFSRFPFRYRKSPPPQNLPHRKARSESSDPSCPYI